MTYLDEQEFNSLLYNMAEAPYIAVDTEGTLNHPFSQTWGLSTCANGVSEYFGFNHAFGTNLPQEWLPKLAEVITHADCLIFHHAKHDLRALRNLGIDYKGPFYDTMLMFHMVDENLPSKELEWLTKMIGGQPKRNYDFIKSVGKFGYEFIPTELWREYGAGDASDTHDLFNYIFLDFDAQGFTGELWEWEQKFCRLLIDIENAGTLVDQDHCQRELEIGQKVMYDIQRELGFNPGSTVELGKFFLEDLNLPVVKKTPKGKPCFDKFAMEIYDELLQQIQDKRAEQILVYRGWQKTCGSNYRPYLENLGPDGKLRTNYKQHGTVTGRLSASWHQQMPRVSEKPWNGKLKQAFIVEKGRTGWEADYSQLEMRLSAAYAKEEKLLAIFADDSRDLFDEMSADLHMDRQDVKNRLVYPINYGAGADKISKISGISLLAAKARIANYYKQYPGLAKITRLAMKRAKENGYVTYWTGRRRHFDNGNKVHAAFNSVIQGGAFEIVKRQMIRCAEAGLNNDECRMDLQIHDSIRFDIEDGKEHIYIPEIKRILEDVQPDFGVRFKVDVKKWATKEHYAAV